MQQPETFEGGLAVRPFDHRNPVTIKEFIITDGNDIQLTCGIANTNTGVIAFYCFWTPLSSDGNVVAA